MPRKMKPATAEQAAPPQIPAELVEKLIPGPVTAGPLEDIFQRCEQAFIQQAPGAEMGHHLGYAPGRPEPIRATKAFWPPSLKVRAPLKLARTVTPEWRATSVQASRLLKYLRRTLVVQAGAGTI